MHFSGNKFEDNRGKLLFNNDLNLSEVKRMYIIENSNTSIIRAWQAHRIEKRWFVAVDGDFEIKVVEVDDFINPSDKLIVKKYILKAETMDCLIVKPGFATSIQSISNKSKLLVFSDYLLGEVNDEYKFDLNKWK